MGEEPAGTMVFGLEQKRAREENSRWIRLGVVMSFPIMFSIFPISFIFLKGSSLNRVRTTGRRRLRLRKGGAKSQSSKIEGKITIRLHGRGKITNLPFLNLH